MDNLEKIESWVRGSANGCFFRGDILDFIQALKAEKPQPNKGELAYDMLIELANKGRVNGGTTFKREITNLDLEEAYRRVQAKYKEQHDR